MSQRIRDMHLTPFLEARAQDIRYALRGLRAKPGFTAAVVLTLGLGIGANGAMFGIIDRLMFRTPAYLHDPGRVNRVYEHLSIGGTEMVDNGMLLYAEYVDVSRWAKRFDRFAAFDQRTVAVGNGVDARDTPVAYVTASYFGFFDAPPALGRYFAKSEDIVPAGATVAVLSYGFWQTHYAGSAGVLGRILPIEGIPFTIIGVAPGGFAGITDAASPALWVPFTTFAGVVLGLNDWYHYGAHRSAGMQVLVRRRPGVSVASAEADLTSASRRSTSVKAAVDKNIPLDTNPHLIAGPLQLQRGPMADRDAHIVTWIGGVSLIVLLIACANVANLLLARALRRRREIALRLVLGVGRARLLAQLLTESLILALLGGVAGLAIAQGGSQILASIFLRADESVTVATDWRTLGFCAVVALTAGLLTGLAPIAYTGREDIALALKAGQREGTRQRSTLRGALLVLQGTLAVVLLVGAALFARSLQNVRAIHLGYDVDPLMLVHDRGRGSPATPVDRASLGRRLETRALGIPGVEAASRSLSVPLSFPRGSGNLFTEGRDRPWSHNLFTLDAGSPSLFRTMGTRILRGRGITAEDTKNAPKVMIVSEAMARHLWPARDALGQCVRIGADTVPCTTVVGIAENTRYQGLTSGEGLHYHYYLPIEQFQRGTDLIVLIRVRGNASNYVETVRRALQAEMPASSYLVAQTLSEIVGGEEQSWRSGATMFVAFSALALILAAIGLYSVIAFDVTQRTHELGVRIALGAQVRDVLQLAIGGGVKFGVIGVAGGLGITLLAGRFVAPLLFDVSPRDPFILGAVAMLLLGVAILASAIPGLRATRVDPTLALRAE